MAKSSPSLLRAATKRLLRKFKFNYKIPSRQVLDGIFYTFDTRNLSSKWMKKAQLFLIACGIFSVALLGQSKKINLGVELGPSYTFLWGNHFISENNDPTNGYAAGFAF